MMKQIDVLAKADNFLGHVAPHICWAALCEDDESYLIDVRTRAEWAFVGLPDMAEARGALICAEWQSFPEMQVNADFVPRLRAQIADKDASLFFLCRSGARSQSAAGAMTQAGYTACYNVAGGFEGDADEAGHRGQVNGWKVARCPWRQK